MNKIYRYLLFDLDGTLTDSGDGIIHSVLYALHKFNIEVNNKMMLYSFIGPPLAESFQKYYHFSQEQALLAVQYYREYFSEKGMFENKVIAGMDKVLEELKDSGKKLIVATSKPEEYTIKILEHFNLLSYFEFVAGATMNEVRNTKTAVIEYALKNSNIFAKNEAVMIGDRKHDIEGAKNNGIDSVGVLFGYGDREELEQAGADYIVESVDELKNLLNNSSFSYRY